MIFMKNNQVSFNIIGILVAVLLVGCSATTFKRKWTLEQAPKTFTVVFETTKGPMEFQIERRYSPEAVDRFYQLSKHHYFDNNFFYRTIPNFVAQFGTYDTVIQRAWEQAVIKDEPVVLGNAKGTISFARSGPNSRGTDLYINLVDNHRLDTISYNEVVGFPAFGKLTKGENVLEQLYTGYASTSVDSLNWMYRDTLQFKTYFPKLDRIKRITILEN